MRGHPSGIHRRVYPSDINPSDFHPDHSRIHPCRSLVYTHPPGPCLRLRRLHTARPDRPPMGRLRHPSRLGSMDMAIGLSPHWHMDMGTRLDPLWRMACPGLPSHHLGPGGGGAGALGGSIGLISSPRTVARMRGNVGVRESVSDGGRGMWGLGVRSPKVRVGVNDEAEKRVARCRLGLLFVCIDFFPFDIPSQFRFTVIYLHSPSLPKLTFQNLRCLGWLAVLVWM
jgi:hypothetical protein